MFGRKAKISCNDRRGVTKHLTARQDYTWTSRKTDFRQENETFVALKITLVDMTYPGQRPELPSLSHYFLLLVLETKIFLRLRVYRDCIVGVLQVAFSSYNRPCVEKSKRYEAPSFWTPPSEEICLVHLDCSEGGTPGPLSLVLSLLERVLKWIVVGRDSPLKWHPWKLETELPPSLTPSAVLPGQLSEEPATDAGSKERYFVPWSSRKNPFVVVSNFQFVKKVPSLFAVWLT